jgi:hypothetical protein
MSFLTGKMQLTTGTDPAAMGLKGSTLSRLGGVDPLTGLDSSGGIPPALMQLFHDQLGPALGQAKESAGNLTGSGLGNILGATAGRSLSDFLINMLSGRANRATSLTGQALQPQPLGYKPGFLDYLFQGASAAAPFFAGA